MNQENLLNKIRQKDAKAFTHGGKFHADDIFSSALLLYLNPEIQITRGNQVPEEYDGIVFDIGRGAYDHHQKDSRVRENGIPYAAFGLLWEELGTEILGEELAEKLKKYNQKVTFLGDGVPVFREHLKNELLADMKIQFAPAHLNRQRAAAVGALGMNYYREGRTVTAMEHRPDYLRVSQAERERAEREKKEKSGQ